MSKRDREGKFARQHSLRFIVASWVASFVSLVPLYFTGGLFLHNFGQFRSCGRNTSLVVHGCGKQSFNAGDLIILVLFVGAAALAASLFTASWRMSRRTP